MASSRRLFPRPYYRIYAGLSRLPGLRRSFTAKVMTVAFVATHLPLLTILLYLVVTGTLTDAASLPILLLGLGATLLGFGGLGVTLKALLRPVTVTQRMLSEYARRRRLLRPPLQFEDEMGQMMRGTAETLAALDAHVERLASHDPGTGALNALGMRRASARLGEGGAVLLLQIRRFGNLQAALGHEAGEFLLRTVLDRFRLELGDAALLATPAAGRVGVLLPPLERRQLNDHAERLLEAVVHPVRVQGREMRLQCAAAMARRGAGQVGERALAAAEIGVLAALEEEGTTLLDADVGGARLVDRLRLAEDLEGALARGELYPVYQARVRAGSHRLTGYETLVRWQHPRRGQVSPQAFLDLAESNDTIVALGRQMLERAAAQAARWRGRGMVISVNVAARQLQRGDLVDEVRGVLARHRLEPGALELEVTESSLLLDLDAARDQLQALRELGVQLALDDFGTGYSSLSYLSAMPVDRIKLDLSFTQALRQPRVAVLVQSIIELAHRLELEVTAEGVEHRAQAERLHDLRCDELQGYLFGRPVPAAEVRWGDG